MPRVIQQLSPFKTRDVVVEEVAAGSTIQDWFEKHGEFKLATVCHHNDQPVLRDEWPNIILAEDDIVRFQSYPGWPYVFQAVIAIAASYAITALNSPNDIDTAGHEQSPTYNLTAQSNRARLYQPITDHYGTVRVWPDLAAQPYREFGANNTEILYQLFLVGHGEYEYQTLRVEDTPITNFEEISTQFIGPGETVTLFPDNVETSVEVGGINLTDTTYRGGFIASQASTQSDRLSFDFVCPRGVYRQNKSGSYRQWKELQVQMECREVDDFGVAVSAGWTVLGTRTITSVNRDAVRITYNFNVPTARYEARVKRLSNPVNDVKIQDDCQWAGLKAFIVGSQNYGNVSLIAVRADATNDLSSKSQFRFNIVATRKLPVWKGFYWSPPEATNNIASALRHMLLADYGGGRSEEEIDLEKLQSMDADWNARGDEFNYRFDRGGNIWKNLKIAGKVGRSSPNLDGSIVTFDRHEPQSLPITMFNTENIKPGSFSVIDQFPDDDSEDHIIVQYFDKTTWRQEEVVCVWSGGTQLRPKTIQLPGITGRQQAYREGMYEVARLHLMTTTVKLTTELEGVIPQFMNLVAVGHDMPSWSQSGHVVNVSGTTLTLSQDLTWGAGNHYIGFRKKNGSLAGPFLAAAGPVANQVVIAAPLGFTPYTGGKQVRTIYQFGDSSEFFAQAVVIDAKPNGETVTITALLENAAVHATVGPAPELNYDHALEADPVEPIVTGLEINPSDEDPNIAIATWNQAPGAEIYIVQRRSSDNTTWLPAGNTAGLRQPLVLESGTFEVRIAAKGALRGPWISKIVNLTARPRVDYYADVFYQSTGPISDDLDVGDIWIKTDAATNEALAGYQYLETDPLSWLDATIPEYTWAINDNNHAMIIALVNAHNAARTAAWSEIDDDTGGLSRVVGGVDITLEDGTLLQLESGSSVGVQTASDVAQQTFLVTQAIDANVNDLQSDFTNLNENVSGLQTTISDMVSGVSDIYVSDTAPVAGVGDTPDPIPKFSRWYDSSNSNKPYYWDDTAWVPFDDGRISVNSSDIVALQSEMLAARNNIDANASAIDTLDTAIISSEDTVTVLSNETIALKVELTKLKLSDNSILEDEGGITIDLETPGDVAKATSEAVATLDVRATTTEGSVESHATELTSLKSELANANGSAVANAGAITGLTSRVTITEDVITSQATEITSLDSTVNSPTTGLVANAGAIAGLTSRVSAAEDVITSQATEITSLDSTVNNPVTGIEATATAITSLDSRVSSTEGVNTAQASSITGLSTTVGGHESSIASHQTSIDGIMAEWGVLIDANGTIVGISLIGGPDVSTFRILANQLELVDPQNPGSSSLPFSVVGGVTTMQNVVVNGTLLVNGTIVTEKIAANAASILTSAFTATSTTSINGYTTIQQLSYTSVGETVEIHATAYMYNSSNTTMGYIAKIVRDNDSNPIFSSDGHLGVIQNFDFPLTITISDQPPAGPHTYYLKVQRTFGQTGQLYARSRYLRALESIR